MVYPAALLTALFLPMAEPNPVFQTLVKEGVPLDAGTALRLPAPTMPDGLDAAQQQAAVASVADVNRPVEALMNKSVVAPFVLKTDGGQVEGPGRHVDLWFVAYGEFEKVTSQDFLKQRMKKTTPEKREDGLPEKSVALKPEEIERRGLKSTESADYSEGYGYALFPLFDSVLLSVTSHVVDTRNSESVLVASVLDPRFQDDKEYPIFWQHLDRDENGMLHLGEKHSYRGMGSYAKITKLIEPAGAMFIEYHVVFDEPHGWFNGANLIRSKLPILVQDNVRKFRREIR